MTTTAADTPINQGADSVAGGGGRAPLRGQCGQAAVPGRTGPAEATPLADDVHVVAFARTEPVRITTTAYVDPGAPFLAGHYPGFPIFPGVCLIECAHRSVRTAGRLLGLDPALAGVRSARFLRPVLPGDDVRTDVELTTAAGRWSAKATATVGDRRVATVRLDYALTGSEDGAGADAASAADAAALYPELADPAAAIDAGPEQIALRLPHRHPMLLVDRVRALAPGRAVHAVKAVTAAEPWFRPRQSAETVDDRLPASLLIESWCQAACLLASWDAPNPDVLTGQVLLFGSLADVAVTGPVRAGDVIEHRARLGRTDGGVYVFEGTATVAGRPVLRVGQALVALRPAAALTGART